MKHTRTLLILFAALLAFPASSLADTTVYFYSGSPTWTAPQGVAAPVSVWMEAGGGGGGGNDGYGDNHAGGGGGSGGYTGFNANAVAGTTYQFIIGMGGAPGIFTFNGNYLCSPSGTTGTKNGANGGNTSLWGPSGQIAYVTGGIGGIGNTSDNGDGVSGAGGSPSGVAGGYISPNRNAYPATYGGSNGLANAGGNSNGNNGYGSVTCPTAGGNGHASVTYKCVDDTPYTETNPSSIASYCQANGVYCGSGYTYVSSLSCHQGAGTWQPFGPSCTGPYCTGCGCVANPAPTVSLGAFSPSTILTGQSSTISFSSTNATSCSGSGIWNGNLGGTSATNISTGAMNTAGTYSQSVTCTGPGGSTTSGTQYLTVRAPASCSYSGTLTWNTNCSAAVNTTVASGNSTTINNTAAGYNGSTVYSCNDGTWTQGATSCTVAPTAPSVTTSAASSITQTSAVSGGTINSNGGAAISVSGIVWSTSANPTTGSYIGRTTDGWSSGGPWSDSMTGLSSGTTYHVRAYATNSVGTSYGADVSFTTTSPSGCAATTISGCSLSSVASGGTSGSCAAGYSGSCNFTCSNGTWSQNSNSCAANSVPTVTTSAVSSINQTSATSGGTINSNGGSAITVSGIVWSTSANPTTALATKTTDGWATGGPWSDSMTGLTAGTIYHVRAYATNAVGTSYGADVSFTTTAPPSSCAATTITNCVLSAASSGSSSGSCASGYLGSCSYTCNNGTWNVNSNSCTANGSVTASPLSCSIAAGASSCNVQISWNAAGWSNPYIVRNGTTVLINPAANTGTNVTVPATINNNVYQVYSDAYSAMNPIASSQTVVASCASGTWNGTICNSTSAPTVTTSAVSGITQTGATSGGTINSDGGSTVTVSGITWGTTLNPTTANSTKTTDGWATGGPWSDSMTGLSAGTTYHVRAYATNAVGTSYGADVQFTTTAPSNCAATTIGNCSLPTTASGSSAGSCAGGYSGACSYACSNGTWTMTSNSCAVSTPAATATFTASPNPVAYGGRSTLTWSSTNATSCTAGGPWSNAGTLSGSGLTDPLTSPATFTFQCTGPGGTSPLQSVTVNVNAGAVCTLPWGGTIATGASVPAYNATTVTAPDSCTTNGHNETRTCTNGSLSGSYTNQNCQQVQPVPTASLSASPTTINRGQSSTLTWSSTSATSCTAAGGFSTGNATSGSAAVSPSTTSTYSITCTGSGGTSSPANATVTVVTPSLSISASPNRVQATNSSVISWTATGVSSCAITKNGSAWRSGSANGSNTYAGSASDVINARSKYVLSCTDVGGAPWPTTADVTVNIVTGFQEF